MGPARPVVLATRVTANMPRNTGAAPSAVRITAAAGMTVPPTKTHSGGSLPATMSAQGTRATTSSATVSGARLSTATVTMAAPSAASERLKVSRSVAGPAAALATSLTGVRDRARTSQTVLTQVHGGVGPQFTSRSDRGTGRPARRPGRERDVDPMSTRPAQAHPGLVTTYGK